MKSTSQFPAWQPMEPMSVFWLDRYGDIWEIRGNGFDRITERPLVEKEVPEGPE